LPDYKINSKWLSVDERDITTSKTDPHLKKVMEKFEIEILIEKISKIRLVSEKK